MSQKRLIEYSGAGKRIFAFFIDILCTLLIAINLNNFLFSNLAKESLGTTVLEEKYKERLVDSHLYILKDDGLCYSIDIINHDNSMSEEEYILYLDTQLTLFYLDEDFECSNIEQYNDLKKNKEDVFRFDNSLGLYVYLDNIDNANEKKIIMREIVICKYLEYMTVEETIARVMIEYNIELTKSKYYRIYNEVMTVLENIIQSDED